MIDFPNSPTLDEAFSAGGKQWQWTGTAWSRKGGTPPPPVLAITNTEPTQESTGVGPGYDIIVNGTNFIPASGTLGPDYVPGTMINYNNAQDIAVDFISDTRLSFTVNPPLSQTNVTVTIQAENILKIGDPPTEVSNVVSFLWIGM
jgi:hypothetical protein